jgi:hypothetical protein
MRAAILLATISLAVAVSGPSLAGKAEWQSVEKAIGVTGSMQPGEKRDGRNVIAPFRLGQ